MNTNYICFLVLSFFTVVHATSSKTEQAFAECMQDYENDNARMACARIMLSLSLDEQRSEQNEHDSECVKKCKDSVATIIADLRSSVHEDEALFPTVKLLRSENRAKLLKEQFLQCMKECKH